MRASGAWEEVAAGGFRRNTTEPSSYIVFVMKHGKPAPLQIRTGSRLD